MSLGIERLHRLKREAGARREASPPAGVPDTTLDRLRSLVRVRARPSPGLHGRDRELPGIELSPGLHFSEERLVEVDLPHDFDASFDRGERVAADDLLFFDTETTGLAGGTGTRAFMVGIAQWTDGALHVRQLTIANMAAEAAMLDVLADWVSRRAVLCSYNGKCYDAPLLATRYRLARRAHPLAGLRHVDLLFPTRRRYRGVYENCRLATIEREVLRIVRDDDLPGSEAPAAWLTYLRGGDATLLRRVQAHNRQDVITLASLFRHLAGARPAD